MGGICKKKRFVWSILQGREMLLDCMIGGKDCACYKWCQCLLIKKSHIEMFSLKGISRKLLASCSPMNSIAICWQMFQTCFTWVHVGDLPKNVLHFTLCFNKSNIKQMEQDMVKMWKSDAYNSFIHHTCIHNCLINILKLNMKLDPARYVVMTYAYTVTIMDFSSCYS